ncbi:MAG: acetyl-CoA carboxylase carboxyltransferase subunit alpha [Elusimicrobiota bacterium]
MGNNIAHQTELTPAQKVLLARHPKRPYSLDYIQEIFSDFIELHGDRCYADDRAAVCGFASLNGSSVAIIAQQKGRTLQENIERNFGMMHPEGYRKALRIMKLAEKFSKPVITFVDTPGAYPGIGAEERGQAEAIARNLKEMSVLKVPIISVIIGEGGSGGALAICVADRILMLEHSVFFVCTPEACSSILWKDKSKADQAAKALKLTADDLLQLKIIDEIIPESGAGAHEDLKSTAGALKKSLKKHVNELLKEFNNKNLQAMLQKRYDKYRNIGVFYENNKGGK